MLKPALVTSLSLMMFAGAVHADPTLPDWTAATFDASSANITNNNLAFSTNTLSIFEGEVEDGVERIEVLSTTQTKTILGVQTRVIQDIAYVDNVLVEVALDWYAQDTAGNVWYFGEDVTNYNYDEFGNFTGTDTAGSWIADDATSFPGIQMFTSPSIGDEYYQEWAPGVAFDFAEVLSLTGSVDIDFGMFLGNVIVTGEGNTFDDPIPTIVENKLYAPGTGLVLIQELDDQGLVVYEVPLISQTTVPEPASACLMGLTVLILMRRMS